MDDTFGFTIKGETVQLGLLTDDSLQMLQALHAMQAPVNKIYKGLMTALRSSATPEAWERLTDRLVDGEIKAEDISSLIQRLMSKTVETRQTRAQDQAAPADGE